VDAVNQEKGRAMAKKAKKAKKAATAKKRAAGAKATPKLTAKMRSTAFAQLVEHAHTFEKSPLCYKEYPDGSAQVCKLLPDGTYGDCLPYYVRPVPGPRCG
jgi:hypothetical protein